VCEAVRGSECCAPSVDKDRGESESGRGRLWVARTEVKPASEQTGSVKQDVLDGLMPSWRASLVNTMQCEG
jgi:hypothetical protein